MKLMSGTEPDESAIRELEQGRTHRFEDWQTTPIPRGPTGVYSIWRRQQFLYVGMSWKEPTGKSSGLWGRMNSHASGRRSGDQFCIYICDRFVLPSLSTKEIAEVGEGTLRLDELTKRFIRTELTYRYVLTRIGAHSRHIEERVRRHGLPTSGLPFLNPVVST